MPRPNARSRPRRVALILATPRSGSTLLGAMLGSHSEASMVGEVNRYASFAHKPRRNGYTGQLCKVCEGACPVWDRAVPRSFGRRRFGWTGALWSANPLARGLYEELFDATGARVLVDTSKNAAWARARLNDRRDWRDAEPCVMLLTRDGRGTVTSMRNKSPSQPIAEITDHWVRLVRRTMAAYNKFDAARRTCVRYEDLVADPDAELRRICETVGLDFEPGMAEYWRHDHHPLVGNLGTLSLIANWRHEAGLRDRPAREPKRGNQQIYREVGYTVFNDQRWRAELDATDLEIFESRAGALNRELGYGA